MAEQAFQEGRRGSVSRYKNLSIKDIIGDDAIAYMQAQLAAACKKAFEKTVVDWKEVDEDIPIFRVPGSSRLVLYSNWGDGLGQDAQMRRSMTMPSSSTVRTLGSSSGDHHHPVPTQGYAAATASCSVTDRILNGLTTAGDGNGTGASGRRAETELLPPCWCDAVVAPRRTDCDLEAGGGGAAPTQQPSEEEEVDKRLKEFICQAYAASQPACALAYSALKDVPDHVKLIIFGGLGVSNIVLFAGMVSRSSARRRLAFRLVSCSAVTLLTFSVASQLSGPTYIAITAVVGVLLSSVIILLRF